MNPSDPFDRAGNHRDYDDPLDPGEEDKRTWFAPRDAKALWGEIYKTQDVVEEIARMVLDMNKTAPKSAAGERTLAKAASVLNDAAAITAAASASSAVDAQKMGAISGFIALGDLAAARRTYLEATESQLLAKAAEPLTDAMAAVGTPDASAALVQVVAAVGRLERTVSSFDTRLAALEARHVVPPTRTLAKAPQVQTRKPLNPAGLMAAAQRYVQDPTQMGVVSSLIQRGQLEEAAPIVRAAKAEYESAKTRQEMLAWNGQR